MTVGFFLLLLTMTSFPCPVCSVPYDTPRKKDLCISSHSKATNMLAAVDVLAGSHLEDLKESVRFDFFLILHPLPLLNQLSHQVHHSS